MEKITKPLTWYKKIKRGLKIASLVTASLMFAIGAFYFAKSVSKSDKSGYYMPSDLSEYDRGYIDGRENFRAVVIELNKDTANTYKIRLPK